MAEDWEALPDKPDDEGATSGAPSVELPYAVQLAMAPSGAPLRQPETPTDWEAQPDVAPMSKARAGVLGLASGGTFDFAEEAAGVLAKLLQPKPVKVSAGALEPQPGDPEAVATLKRMISQEQATQPTPYELGRNALRREQQQAMVDQPGTYIPAAVGGGVLSSAFGGAAGLGRLGMAATRAVPRVGQALASAAPLAQAGRGFAAGALGGGLQGAGASEGATAGDVATDALLGAGISGGIGAIPGLVRGAARVPGVIRGRAAQGVATAEDDLLQTAMRNQERLENAARGTLGGETQKGSRQHENMLRYLSDPNAEPWRKAEVEQWLRTPDAQELIGRVIEHNLEDAPTQQRAIDNARQTLADLVAAREGNIAHDVEHGRSVAATMREQVAPRFANMGSRIAGPLLGAAVGGLAGGEENRGSGIGAGTLAGTLLNVSIGNPTITLRNMMRAPSVRRALWGGLEGLSNRPANVAETLQQLAAGPVGQRLTQGAQFAASPVGRAAAAQTMGAAASASTLRALLEQAERDREDR